MTNVQGPIPKECPSLNNRELQGIGFTRNNRSIAGIVLGILLAAGGCAVGPDYKRPEATAQMPAAYAGATNGWKVAAPQAHLSKGSWWEIFGDAELNGLETKATTANQELKAAVASFQQARALVGVARSGYFPRIGLSPT